MTSPRPTAVGYLSASTTDAADRQRATLEAHARAEGMNFADALEDPRDSATFSELLAITEFHSATRVLLPADTPMATRHRPLTDVLARIDAASVVVPATNIPTTRG